MSNTWDLWSDWKDKISPYYKKAETGLLGQEQRTMHPSEGVISSRRGGAFGHGGLYDKSLEYAGGKVQDYVSGQEQAVSPPSTYGSTREEVDSPGFRGSEMDKDIH